MACYLPDEDYQALLQRKEIRALAEWKSSLRQGMLCADEDRWQEAMTHFELALDIGILRRTCSKNTWFDCFHIERPLRHMMDYCAHRGKYRAGQQLLLKVTAQLKPDTLTPSLKSALTKHLHMVTGLRRIMEDNTPSRARDADMLLSQSH